jgi:hypothetical protein
MQQMWKRGRIDASIHRSAFAMHAATQQEVTDMTGLSLKVDNPFIYFNVHAAKLTRVQSFGASERASSRVVPQLLLYLFLPSC